MGVASSDGVDRPAGLAGPGHPPPRHVAISLQSGSLGASVLRLADELGMGLSWFISLGDKSDVSGNDLLQFWEDDETTRVIAMYTESFGNPRKFARIARRVSRHRPIVAVRTGAAAIGPTGSALYQQAGLIEVPTVAVDARHRPGARHPAGAAGPPGRRAGQRPQPRDADQGRAHDSRAGAGRAPPIPLDWRSTPRRLRRRRSGPRWPPTTSTASIVVHAPPLAAPAVTPVDDDRRPPPSMPSSRSSPS